MAAFVNKLSGGNYGEFHVDDTEIKHFWREVEYIQVEGHELEKACNLLSRDLPQKRVFKFIGEQAKTIVVNW